jgi:tetratricopeptide (TPR) repeat protein
MNRVDFAQKFPQMKPGKGTPTLTRINGCGVGMYGSRDHDAETETYVSTWCASIVFVPVLCLRAYRVSKAARGWYFIGREPLSTLAKGWNALVLLCILAGVGLFQYDAYTSSPAYKAKKQMSAAHEYVAAGQLFRAARIYQTLAVSNSDQAAAATASLKSLMDSDCSRARLDEAVGVISAAAQVARRGHVLTLPEVLTRGLGLTAEKGDADPKNGVAMLDAVRPLAIDTRAIDARRMILLRAWAAKEPANLEVIIPLAALLEQQSNVPEAKKLLLPVRNSLGDGEGARVLGTILSREGDYDGAHALLWPYVKSRLDRLHDAEKGLDDAVKSLWDREIDLLQKKKAPSDFYTKYENAATDDQQAMVRTYVNARIKDDPAFTGSQEALEQATGVVPVALELGIVMLYRAQSQQDATVRKTQLEAAEKVFLAIGGVAGQSDEYRLSLGQVYYWLGKQVEGRKLFDDYLSAKGRAAGDLLQIAMKLRSLGAVPEARLLSEEAFQKASKPEDKQGVAKFRAKCNKDLDDAIEWLSKANTADPEINAELAKAKGDKAMEEGRDPEAASEYQTAIDAYAGMPRSATTVNQTALVYYSVFQSTGDHAALERCFDSFQQAVTLSPGDPILLYNAGMTMMEAAFGDIIGNKIDLRTLHESGTLSHLRFLYADEASREDFVQRVKDHPGIARALSYLEKAMVLSPKDGKPCGAIYEIHRFTQNEPALRSLLQRIQAAGLDSGDQLAAMKEHLAGAKDTQYRIALAASIKRSEERSPGISAASKVTAAIALSRRAELMMSLATVGGTVDPDKIIALAQQAHALAPSAGTHGALMSALVFRAHQSLCGSNPAFDAACKKYDRSIGFFYLIAYLASEPGEMQQKIVKLAEMQKVFVLMHEDALAFPKGRSGYEWALLRSIDAAAAEKAAESLRQTPLTQLESDIQSLQNPYSAGDALESLWLARIFGKPDAVRDRFAAIAAAGIPIPSVR